MDYECDVGYERTVQGTCQKIDEESKKDGLNEDQQAMCDTFGYYLVTQGYRKVPGNRCTGGLDMNPYVYSCSAMGGYFTLRNLLMVIITVVCLYFGWPIIEAIIILLPIPDPKELKEKAMSLFNRKSDNKKSNTGKGSAGYTGNFN